MFTVCVADETVDLKSDSIQTLNIAAVAGITIAGVVVGFSCGLLTGILIEWWRRRPRKLSTTSASGDPGASSQIVYEKVLPPKPVVTIAMQENVSYGPVTQ